MAFLRYWVWALFLGGIAWGESPASSAIPQLPVAPEGEKLVFKASYEQLPGLGLELLRSQGHVTSFSSAESVGDGASLMVYQKGNGGALFSDTISYETFEQRGNFTNFTGLSFWVRGDGSAAEGVIGFTSMDLKKGPSSFNFPLSNTNWHKVFVPWTEFIPRIKYVKKPSAFVLGLTSPGLGTRWYLMDRLHLYQDEVVEDIEPTEPVALVHDLPVAPWLRRSRSFDSVLRKLEQRNQFSLMFLVDEEAVGKALMGNVVLDTYIKNENFAGRLGRKLRKKYSYHEGYTILESYFMPLDEWVPASDSPLRRARFETVSLIFGGVQTDFINKHFPKIKSYDPDVVIVQHGLHDMLYGSIEAYRESLSEVVKGIKEAGAEAVICSPFPMPDFVAREHLGGRSPWEVGADYAQVCDEIALKYEVSYVDFYGAFNARGPLGLAEVFFHKKDLKLRGHEMASELLFGLVDSRRIKIWREAPGL